MKNQAKCGIIGTNQERVTCPGCGFLLAMAMPRAKVSGLLIRCRKCKIQVEVNIPEPES